MVELSPKQRRIINAKLKGKKNKEIAPIEYPNAKEHSGEVLISRELKKPHVAQYYDKELSVLLAEHNVTKNQYLMNIGEAMQATKQNQFTGEVTPDHATRLQANKQAERFLDFDSAPLQDIPDLTGLDEIALTHAVFKRNKGK